MSHCGVIYVGNTDTMPQAESSPNSVTTIPVELYELQYNYLYANHVNQDGKKVTPV